MTDSKNLKYLCTNSKQMMKINPETADNSDCLRLMEIFKTSNNQRLGECVRPKIGTQDKASKRPRVQQKARIQHRLKQSAKQSQSNSARGSTAIFSTTVEGSTAERLFFSTTHRANSKTQTERRSFDRINLVSRVSRKETATTLINQSATYQET